MSVGLFLKDVFTGNETNALARLKNWWETTTLLKGFDTMLGKWSADELKLIEAAAEQGATKLLAGGLANLTLANFAATVEQMGVQLAEQSITAFETELYAYLNTAVTTQAAAANIALPTNSGTTAVPASTPAATAAA